MGLTYKYNISIKYLEYFTERLVGIGQPHPVNLDEFKLRNDGFVRELLK